MAVIEPGEVEDNEKGEAKGEGVDGATRKSEEERRGEE